MRLRLIFLFFATVAAIALSTSGADSQEEPSAEEMAEGMKRWQEAATPGEQHTWLARAVGTWETSAKFWMGGPDSPAMEATGKSVFHTILDGRFVVENLTGQMMGMPFSGHGVTGYDNFRKRFTAVWMDNMGTGIYRMNGHRSDDTLTMIGEMDEVMTGEIGKLSKFVTTWKSEDEFVVTAYDLAIGPDARVMEITYRRTQD